MFLLVPKSSFAQEQASYSMDFLRAVQITKEDKNYIIVVFRVTPTIEDFKLIMSMRVFYELGNGEKMIDVQKQKEDNIKIQIFGKDIESKNKAMYNLIKSRLSGEILEKESLIVFQFSDVTKEKVEKMSMTYGLWETKDSNIRHEKRYDFNVEAFK